MRTNTFLILSLLCVVCFMSCDDDDTGGMDTTGLITTVNITFTPNTGGSIVTLSYVDLDGEGGEDPVITGGILNNNTSYIGSIELLDESVSPARDVTTIVREEAEDFQFFFLTNVRDLIFNYTDDDENGNPLGLQSNPRTDGFDTGTMTVILRHFPDKFGTNVADGDITNAGGETDIEVTFPLNVF